MNLQDYSDTLNVKIELTYYPNQSSRWTAKLERCEIKNGSMLSGAYGDGKTPEAAIKDYELQLRGQKIVLGAYTDARQEFNVPMSLGEVAPDLAQRIVAAIEKDFTDRRVLRQEWEQIDDDIQVEIRDKWAEIIRQQLEK